MREDERLERALRGATGVLFLCSGNMIRSAFAELYARHLGCALPVRSAATTYRNDAIYPQARAALLARGVPAETIAVFRPTVLLDIPHVVEHHACHIEQRRTNCQTEVHSGGSQTGMDEQEPHRHVRHRRKDVWQPD